ncbi:MAG: PEPxxWA-CTERM sorting domain-containing protein [Phenylobacterium sp.]
MKKNVLLAALAASALMAGSAEAATIFSQNFNGGLGANESVGGNFAVGSGNVGHQGHYYANDEYSFYQLRLDLTKATDAMLTFDFDINSEAGYDALNLAASTNGVFGRSNMITPTSGALYSTLSGRAATLMGGKGISGVRAGQASFDLTPLIGQVVDIRFQFASDYAAFGQGVGIDNLLVTGTLPSAVPEPATWAMMITGFGLAGASIRKRRRTFATA